MILLNKKRFLISNITKYIKIDFIFVCLCVIVANEYKFFLAGPSQKRFVSEVFLSKKMNEMNMEENLIVVCVITSSDQNFK